MAAAGLAVFLTVGFSGTAYAGNHGQNEHGPDEHALNDNAAVLVSICHRTGSEVAGNAMWQTLQVAAQAIDGNGNIAGHAGHGDRVGACSAEELAAVVSAPTTLPLPDVDTDTDVEVDTDTDVEVDTDTDVDTGGSAEEAGPGRVSVEPIDVEIVAPLPTETKVERPTAPAEEVLGAELERGPRDRDRSTEQVKQIKQIKPVAATQQAEVREEVLGVQLEIRPAAAGVHRPSAFQSPASVLPATGVGDDLGLLGGTGATMVLIGVLTLVSRRHRPAGC